MIPLANHLWQSTLFACVAGLITLALRSNRASVRYWLWLAASIKFLVPFSVLMSIGNHIEWRTAPVMVRQSSIPAVMEQLGQTFTAPVQSSRKFEPEPSTLPMILFAVWGCGFMGVALTWFRKYRRVRLAVRASRGLGNRPRSRLSGGFFWTPLAFSSIPVVSSRELMEPGIFGIFRPVLLLPEGILTRLTAAQLDAVVAHELCHVRRRDNLTAAIHMVVETIFWFHPLVWWIGTRMIEERERACDEEVLRSGSEPRVYAESILKVCEFYLETPVACVAGVTGANLKKRVRVIVENRVGSKLNLGKKTMLAAMGLAAVAGPLVVGTIDVRAVRAQPVTGSTLKFEVASIHRGCAPRGSGDEGPGRIAGCTTLRAFIRDAYVLNKDGRPHPGYRNAGAVPIEGGPGWINSDRYTINAKAEGAYSSELLHGPMLQALLEDRFKLKIHRELRMGPAYALTVAKGGAKLQKWEEGSCLPMVLGDPIPPHGQIPCGPEPPRVAASGLPNFTTVARAFTLDDFSALLFSMMDRPVINQTGIAGRFDFQLEYAPDQNTPMILSWLRERTRPGVDPGAEFGTGAVEPKGIPILNALQQQLKLKLEPTKAPREFLVIDHAERPSEN